MYPYDNYNFSNVPPAQNYGYNNMPYSQQQPQRVNTTNTNKIYVSGIEDVRTRILPAGSDYIFLDNDKIKAEINELKNKLANKKADGGNTNGTTNPNKSI